MMKEQVSSDSIAYENHNLPLVYYLDEPQTSGLDTDVVMNHDGHREPETDNGVL